MIPPVAPPAAISQPAPLPLTSPAYVQKYNQVRKALGMDSSIKDVFQRTQTEGFMRQITLSDNSKKGWGFQVTFDQDSGALIGIRCTPRIEALSKKYKETPGPLLTPQATEAILSSLLPFSIPAHDRKNWEVISNDTPQEGNDQPDFFPKSYLYLRRQVDNTTIIASKLFLIADAQLGEVSHYGYEEGVIIPQAAPLLPEAETRALAQKLFLEAGGSPKAKCRLVWDKVAWWPVAGPLSRLTYRYEFQLKEDTAPENSLGAIWSVPIDAQTGEVWWIRIETGGGGPDVAPVKTQNNIYLQRFYFAADSPDAQKLGIAALSIPKAAPAPAPEKVSCLVTPKRKVYYSWDATQSRLAFSLDSTKDWVSGVLPEKAAKPFMEWLKTQKETVL